MDWKKNIIADSAGIKQIIRDTRRIAVIGIKMEPNQPAYYVPDYMRLAGYEIVPVPVYYPDATEILGEKVYRTLVQIPGAIDLVSIFRRSKDVAGHVGDILEKKPKAVWMQSGIYDDDVAEQLARADIKVVQNLCLMVEHRRLD